MSVLNLYVVHLSDRAVSILAVILSKCIPGKCILAMRILGTLPILILAILIRDCICNMGWNGILCRSRGASGNDQSCGDWKQRSHFRPSVESIGRVATNGASAIMIGVVSFISDLPLLRRSCELE